MESELERKMDQIQKKDLAKKAQGDPELKEVIEQSIQTCKKIRNYIINHKEELEEKEIQEMETEIEKIMDNILLIIDGEPREEAKNFLAVANSQLYHTFRNTISTGNFKEEGKWPEADLSSKALAGKAYIMPDRDKPIMGEIEQAELQTAMREKVMNLQKHGDLAADVFDIITAKWLKETKHYESMVNITADDFMKARGLKGKDGEIGGRYTEAQRKDIREQIDILSYTWITVEEMEAIQVTESGKRKKSKWRGESKAVVLSSRFGQIRVDGSTDAYAWRLRPGDVFAKFLHGPGRQTALLSQKALRYDHYRQKWEKRLARYFAWIWRISSQRTMEGVTVKTLLEVTGDIDTLERPGRARERLEKALDRLEDDGVITAWQYEAIKESEAGKRGWVDNWLNCKIIVEPPQEILDHYKELQKIDPAAELNAKTVTTTKDRIKNTRKEHGLTLTRAAEEIGINASTLSRIERGGNLSGKTADKVKKWLKQYEG